jgi:hypothetical protein
MNIRSARVFPSSTKVSTVSTTWIVRLDGLARSLYRIPPILAPLIAYVGEVMRNATGGTWAIRTTPGQDWEPVIVSADGRRYSTFVIFKELLERGSVRAAIHYEILRQREH